MSDGMTAVMTGEKRASNLVDRSMNPRLGPWSMFILNMPGLLRKEQLSQSIGWIQICPGLTRLIENCSRNASSDVAPVRAFFQWR